MIRQITLAASLAIGSAAFASPVNWNTPAGSLPDFDYSEGQSVIGAFGSSTIATPGAFLLFPEQFFAIANANNQTNVSATREDTVSVILQAKPELVFSRITGNIFGDWSILGTGSVDASGALRVTNLDTLEQISTDLLMSGVPASTTSSDDGVFSGETALDLPAGWDHIKIELDGLVASYASRNGTSIIEAKTGSIGVETAVIPLPAAILAAPVVGWMALRARRKMTTR